MFWAKRLIDVVLAFMVLVLGAPLWLLICFLIKLDSAGPALFVQERVGKNGQHFRMWKFRTMYTGNDDRIHREYVLKLIQQNAEAGKEGTFKLQTDPRITRVGRFLRKTSLDEIPQLLNVLKGDMSLVGPRPCLPWELEHYQEWHKVRLQAPPGITGLWQVSGRSNLDFSSMVRLDIEYIENWSIGLDIKILLLTIPAVLKIHQSA